MRSEIEILALHALFLAGKHTINVFPLPAECQDSAQANLMSDGHYEARIVFCAPVIDETTYMIQLHEMGHLVAPGGMFKVDELLPIPIQITKRMDQEDAAWAWARETALVWTLEMEVKAQWARETYRHHLERTVKRLYIRSNRKNVKDWR